MSFNPFEKDIETKYLYETEDLKNAKNRLEFLKQNKGLALFTGDAGIGKTIAIRNFCDSLNPSLFKVVYLSMSTLTVMEFYRALALELGLELKHKKIDNFKQIQEEIIRLVKDKKVTPILVIDEAQYLRTDIINDLKILLNFEMDSKNYLTIILIGLPILINILGRNIHEAIKQRIVVSYHYVGINKDEVNNYINSRFELCNGSSNIFNENAKEALFSSCNGSIRVLNNLIVKSLIIGANKQLTTIDNNIILEAFNEVCL